MRPSSQRCLDRVLGETLLAAARAGRAPHARAHVQHMAACESCRAAVERARRLAATWKSLEPTPEETARAMVRFRCRPSLRRSPPTWAKAVVVGAVVAATGVCAAAVRVLETRGGGRSAGSILEEAPLVERSASVVATPRGGADRGAAPRIEEAPLPPPPLRSGGGLAPSAQAVRPAPTGETPSAERVSEREAPSPWILAAEAMRINDYAGAERAFNQLAASPDAHTRDAARLARAQLWIALGRASDARAELERLRISSATATLREQAAEAFQSLAP